MGALDFLADLALAKKICNTLKVIEHPKMHSMVSSRTSACLYGLDQRSDDATVMRKNDMCTPPDFHTSKQCVKMFNHVLDQLT